MPRLVRRDPLSKRLKEYLDPYDFLLWLSELLQDDTYDEWLNGWALFIGIGLNILFIVARWSSASRNGKSNDDAWEFDSRSGGSWFVSPANDLPDDTVMITPIANIRHLRQRLLYTR